MEKSNNTTQVIFKPTIYKINGEKIILDSDLAKCLNMDTKRLNENIKRHIDEFYDEDYYQLDASEYELLRLQNATLKENFATLEHNFGTLEGKGKHTKYLPYVFTYEGVNTLMEISKKEERIIVLKRVLELLKDDRLIITNSINAGETLERYIYEVRGVHVMLDFDLACLYECQNGAKTVNLAVKRNQDFPDAYVFQLTEEEFKNLRFQFETAKSKNRSLPYAFTEEGVAMLATVLRTKVAAQISIKIMDAFVMMKRFLINNSLLPNKYYQDMLIRHDGEIKLLQESFKEYEGKKITSEIYFNGQIYDAYSKLVDIFNEAKEKIIIIDNYADKSVLDIIKSLSVKVIIITKKDSLLSNIDIKKYESQYNNLKVVFNNTFHDRFFIIDDKTLYHCGTSLNKIGSKTFAINKIGDKYIVDTTIKRIKDMI